MWETWVQSLAWEDPLEKGTATHPNILAWRIPWTPWGRKESDTTEKFSSSFALQQSSKKYYHVYVKEYSAYVLF